LGSLTHLVRALLFHS